MNSSRIATSAKAAFFTTLPILIGFGFCGFSYGLYMQSLGFEPIFPILMALTIFAGSLEFIMASMITGPFAPITAFIIGIVVNARHLFYGISMLDRYRDTGALKPYLIYGLIDETFSILGMKNIPEGTDKRWYYFFVTLFNELYWVLSTAVGAIFGDGLPFNTRGIEFVLPALFLAIFASSWQQEAQHAGSLIGLGITLGCLLAFGTAYFLLAAMLFIILLLLIFRKKISSRTGANS